MRHSNKTVEVLYQRMGERWYAFSLIDNEVFFGSISPDEIHAPETNYSISSPSSDDSKKFHSANRKHSSRSSRRGNA